MVLSVQLRPLTLNDKTALRKWLADPYIISLTFVVPGPQYVPIRSYPEQLADRYLEMLVKDATRRSFAIEVDGIHVGNVGLKEYNSLNNTSECFIEIGEENCRGKGVGTTAMAMLLDYGLLQLGLLEIRLEVLEFNKSARHVYEKVGFSYTHRTGWHYDNQQRYWQVLGMVMTKERWLECRSNLEIADDIQLIPIKSP